VSQPKTAFDWRDGTPSIWTRDKELRQITQGKAWGQAAQAKVNLNEKRQVNVYSHAKPSK